MSNDATGLVFGLVLLGLVFSVGAVASYGHWATGQGEHVGYVTAVGESGFVWQTGNVYVKTDTESTTPDHYCFDSSDEELFNKLRRFSRNNEQVVLSSHKEPFFGPWKCASDVVAIIDNVQPVNN